MLPVREGSMTTVSWDDLVDYGVRFLVSLRTPQDVARHVATIAADTEGWGIDTHGVSIYVYFDKMLGTEIDPKAEPLVVRETGATATIDGNRAFGQLAMALATEIGIRKAREQGIAMVGVRDSFWVAGLAVYMVPIVEENLLGQLWVENCSGKDCAPFGGTEKRLSTNPVAFAFPTTGLPMISDFSTAIVAMGKIRRLIRSGEKATEELFLDSEGTLTDDPTVMDSGGSMLFTGGKDRGYKGFAMSLWDEALTAMAGGDTNSPHAPWRQSFNLTVIDPEAFAGKDVYLKEMERLIEYLRSSRKRPGVSEIRLPGERGLAAMTAARENGVPISDDSIRKLNELAEKHGIKGL